jgi:uncharacterized membrane protein
MNQVGYAVCHQLPGRTLQYGGEGLPVCARDTGLFLGFSLCIIALLVVYGLSGDRYPSWKVILALALFLMPAALDAVTSYAGWRETTNAMRLATGALAGTGAAAVVFPLAAGTFGRGEERVVFERPWTVALLLPVTAAVSLLPYPDFPGAFWFWAPAVTGAVLFTFLVLNFTLFSLIFDWVSQREIPLWIPGVIAAAAVALEITVANRLHWLVDRLA